jgi:hypothetical protein
LFPPLFVLLEEELCEPKRSKLHGMMKHQFGALIVRGLAAVW